MCAGNELSVHKNLESTGRKLGLISYSLIYCATATKNMLLTDWISAAEQESLVVDITVSGIL